MHPTPAAPLDAPSGRPALPARRRSLVGLVVALTVATVVLPFAVALAIRRFGYEHFLVPSGSMMPTIFVGETLFAEKFRYGIAGAPVRAGEVVVFEFPRDRTRDFVSRVLAVAGQRVQFDARTGAVSVDGQPLPRCELGAWPNLPEAPSAGAPRLAFAERLGGQWHLLLQAVPRPEPTETVPHCVDAPCVVPAGHVLTVGDNRDESFDGRYWGFVPLALVRARASSVFVTPIAARRSRSLLAAPWVPAPLAAAYAACIARR